MALDTDFKQPDPQSGKIKILDVVIDDLYRRAESGKEKYGTYLETFNGRSALLDGYMEALDLVMYLRQKLLEENTNKLVIADCEITFTSGVNIILTKSDEAKIFEFLNKIGSYRIIIEEV